MVPQYRTQFLTFTLSLHELFEKRFDDHIKLLHNNKFLSVIFNSCIGRF
jgi:hypothetical protein